jgi:hypothetical protein
MINKQASIDALRDMKEHQLITIIDTDYYRSMIACTPENTNDVVDKLITELLEVQVGCGLAERYDLAIVCRKKLSELALHIDVKQMMY